MDSLIKLTKFMKNLIKLLQFDKLHNSIPFLLEMITASIVMCGMLMAAKLVKDEDIKIAALKDILVVSFVLLHMIEISVHPKKTMAMLDLLEEECSVNEGDFKGREELWNKIDKAYKRNIEGMILLHKLIGITLFLCFVGFLNRNAIPYFFRIPIYTDVQFSSVITPFLWFSRLEIDFSPYFFSAYLSQALLLGLGHLKGYLLISAVSLSIEKILADFNTIYIFLQAFGKYFPDDSINNSDENSWRKTENMNSLRNSMAKVVQCHQRICRNYKICAEKSAYMITCLLLGVMCDSCSNAFFILKAQNNVQKAVSFVFMFIFTNLVLFFLYQNGQKIMHQNDVLRIHLAELPWTDKPRWFRQTVHIMMTRANVDFEMKPYGIYYLNYNSFKDLMKFFFSVGNVLARKMANQS